MHTKHHFPCWWSFGAIFFTKTTLPIIQSVLVRSYFHWLLNASIWASINCNDRYFNNFFFENPLQQCKPWTTVHVHESLSLSLSVPLSVTNKKCILNRKLYDLLSYGFTHMLLLWLKTRKSHSWAYFDCLITTDNGCFEELFFPWFHYTTFAIYFFVFFQIYISLIHISILFMDFHLYGFI